MTVEEPKTDTETTQSPPGDPGETNTQPASSEAAATAATTREAATSGETEAGDSAGAAVDPAPATSEAQEAAPTAAEPPAASDAPGEATAAAADASAAEAPSPAAEAPAPAAEAPAAAADTPAADTPAETAAPEAPAPVVDDRPEPTTMEELLAEQSGDIPSLKHGDVVEGTIVRIDKDEMLVDVGAKSEGVVSNRELYGRNAEAQPELNVGDTVLVYVLQPESTDGHAVLSLRRAGLERKWRSMQDQFDEGVIIEAPVIDHNKGGLIVDCGIRGFVPISQIVDFPRRPQNDQPRDAAQEIAEKLQPYVGRKLRLKILEVNRKANRLILSEKVALYEERREKRDELFSSLETGQKVKGTVRSIAPFGIFVDLGGIDGLVHKSELSWNKVNNPEGAYEVGDEVEAEVIDINHERGRISLSIRRLLPDPWQSTVADLKVGDIVDGTVTKIVNFGAFVRVKDGLEGLIHISELSHQRVAHPGDVVHEGQTLKLKIISLDSERHRLGLSLKQAEESPSRPAAPARERRPRGERGGYDRSQAVQEPEGGIDNTLAAAFAQVRLQIAEQDAEGAEEVKEVAEAAETEAVAEAVESEVVAEEAAAVESVAEAVEAEAVAEATEAEAVAEIAEEVREEAEGEVAAALETAVEAEVVAEAAEEAKEQAEAEIVTARGAAVEAGSTEEREAAIEAAVEATEEAEAAEEVKEAAEAVEAEAIAEAVEAEVVAEVAEEVKEEAQAERTDALESAMDAEAVAEAAEEVREEAEAEVAEALETAVEAEAVEEAAAEVEAEAEAEVAEAKAAIAESESEAKPEG